MPKHQPPAKPVAIYARISKDRAGRAEGVKAQEKWGREYIAERWPGASVVVFTDNDLSAADEKVYRPAFEELRQAIRRKEIGGLWAVEQSRLTRLEVVWFGLAADLVVAGIDEVHTRRDGIVPVADEIAGIKAVLNAGETRRIKERSRDLHLRLAAEGRPSGPPGYGYRLSRDEQGRSTYVIEPSEAKIVKEIAKRIIRGDSLISIGEDLTRRKEPTSRGGRWRWNTITSVVTKPQVAGLRQHNGETPVKATWEPILDRKTWNRVRAILDKQEREVTGSDGTQRRVNNRRRIYQRHLLTGGILVCGRCGVAMVVQTARARTDRPGKMAREAYVCAGSRRDGCNRNSIPKDDLDTFVTTMTTGLLSRSDVAKALARQKDDPRTSLLDEIGALQREIDELADLQANGGVTLREWKKMRDPKAQRMATLESTLRNLPTNGVEVGTSADAILREWPTYTLAQKRRVIQLLFSQITILPARERVSRAGSKKVQLVPNPEVERFKRRKVPGLDRFDSRRVRFVPSTGKHLRIDDKVIAGLIDAVGE